MRLRRVLSIAAVLAVVFVAALVGAWFWIGRHDLAALVARRITEATGRAASIGALRVTPGRWVRVEMTDAKLANAAGGTSPEFVTLGRVSAEVDAWSLLHGPFVLRAVSVEGLSLLLEHVADGTANWTVGGGSPGGHAPPMILDAVVTGTIAVRSSSGRAWPIALRGVRLATDAASGAARIAGVGAYNGVPITLTALAGSLMPSTTPVPVDIRLTSGATELRFVGTATDPVSVEGARGALTLTAADPSAIAGVAGTTVDLATSLRLMGTAEHRGDLWRMTDGTGALGSAPILRADLRLDEAPRGKPDKITADIAFDAIDINALLGDRKGAESDGKLPVDRDPGTLVEAKLSAREARFDGARLSDVAVEGALVPGRIEVRAASAGYLGARIKMTGRIEAPDQSERARLSADLAVASLDIQAARRLVGLGALPVTGPLEGRVVVAAEGATVDDVARQARISAVLAMRGGGIARDVVRLVSSDVRRLFGPERGTIGITCALGVLDVRGGVGTVTPVRVRSADGTIEGVGRFDLHRRALDVVVGSDARTTDLLALDVPVRVDGPFASPRVRPAQWSPQGRALIAAGDDLDRLPPELQAFARANACPGRIAR